MDSENVIANGKTARACDSCIKKRARWYCTADDAFLCQTCDANVHSANPLAQRHQRIRLKTASLISLQVPSWHLGFTKKPRTPRPKYHRRRFFCKPTKNPLHLVPEIEDSDEQGEQLIYRVPIFDPEVSLSGTSNENVTRIGDDVWTNNKVGFYEQSDMNVEEFAADVNNLLCKGFDDEESFDMETLGFLDSVESRAAKFEEEGEENIRVNYEILDGEIDMTKETFELNFDDYDSPENYEEEDDKVGVGGELKQECQVIMEKEKKSKILLALNYEGILAAWPEQKSAWTTGDRPELEDSDCWPDCMGNCGKAHRNYPITYVEMKIDGGREARVSRYREKRRSRLYSKKIRYEVRKLNAEKRPRMKGRFVKRANFVAASN